MRPALVWERPLGFREQTRRTRDPERTYTIMPKSNKLMCRYYEFQRTSEPTHIGDFDTLDAAKAAAERHWQQQETPT